MELRSLMLSAEQRSSLEHLTAQAEERLDEMGPYLEGRGIDRDAAVAARLGCGSDEYEGMLSIPYLTPAGVVAIKYRRLGGDGPKYDGPAGQVARLYNVRAIVEGGDVIAICEGELDALVCHSYITPAVAAPGVSWQDHWTRALADFERKLIVVDHDVKEDGSSPGIKHGKSLLTKIPGAELVFPPPGMDLNEWYLAEGPDAIRKAMKIA